MYSGSKGEEVTYGFEKGFYRVGERKKNIKMRTVAISIGQVVFLSLKPFSKHKGKWHSG